MNLGVPGWIAVGILFFVFRHIAVRRVVAGHGRYVWLAFAPALLIAIMVVRSGVESALTTPVLVAPLLGHRCRPAPSASIDLAIRRWRVSSDFAPSIWSTCHDLLLYDRAS